MLIYSRRQRIALCSASCQSTFHFYKINQEKEENVRDKCCNKRSQLDAAKHTDTSSNTNSYYIQTVESNIQVVGHVRDPQTSFHVAKNN